MKKTISLFCIGIITLCPFLLMTLHIIHVLMLDYEYTFLFGVLINLKFIYDVVLYILITIYIFNLLFLIALVIENES